MSQKPEITPVWLNPKLEVLPTQDMPWGRFEALLHSLAKDERGLTNVRVYGEPGQSQYGIDIAGTLPNGNHEAIQCKKRKRFTKRDLTSTVKTFLDRRNNLPFTVATLVVAVACDAQKTEVFDELHRLNEDPNGVRIELWDRRDICDMLRKHRNIVSTFFGDAAADDFCPRDPAPGVRARAVLDVAVPVVGRDEDLRRMATELGHGRTARRPKCLILSGMGGIGKTSLARMYAQHNAEAYGFVALVRGEHAAIADGDYRELLGTLRPGLDVTTVRDARAEVFADLEKRNERWLLVLDDVPNLDALHSLIPPAGDGDVLVTTRARRSTWSQTAYSVLKVEPLTESTSARLLMDRTDDRDQASAHALAARLGGSPLALIHAIGRIQDTADSIASYLAAYRDHRTGPELRGKVHQQDYYPHTIAATVDLSAQHLSPSDQELLGVLSLYAPAAIPVTLLGIPGDDNFSVRSTIEALGRFSLIDVVRRDVVAIHPVVQEVTRDRLRAEDSWAKITTQARRLFDNAMPLQPPNPKSLALWNTLRAHGYALVENLPRHDRATLATRCDLAQWTGFSGDIRAARDQYQELVADHDDALGANDPDTLHVRRRHANWVGHEGNAREARLLMEELLQVCRRELGPHAPQTLEVHHSLAWWTGQEEDYEGARLMYEALVRERTRLSGPTHIDTIRARHNCAHWTGLAGDRRGALGLFGRLVPVAQETLGPNHHRTLAARNGHAFWTGFAGDLETARRLYQRLVEDCTATLGPEHRDTLFAMHYQALHTFAAGRHDEGMRIATLVAQTRARVLGENHSDTQKTRQHLHAWAVQLTRAGLR
ncbi:hypothetical protein ADK67_06365 [Saccharothrix sp. NRRL B-16348]|uniref:tetratricopeptide repeat protein n=1 Tax=Saccharothrix sp. NRRL B-16348 TaxID=1415542 RepID=UPI0006AE6EB4|nr:tetratricopeptide repeat protein [Saccharothrix sp. NRRL B-16348]KOX33406.1 hypothetical protein ADK67_06365 [Saccharothrix sp. NRRL B-16348]